MIINVFLEKYKNFKFILMRYRIKFLNKNETTLEYIKYIFLEYIAHTKMHE